MTHQRSLLAAVVGTAVLQVALWIAATNGWVPHYLADAGLLVAAWALILVLAFIAARLIDDLRRELRERHDLHQATLDQVEQLAALNEMLLTLGQSKDVGLAFQGLARRIGRLIPCDRLALALIKESGQELQAYSARVSEPERRRRPRPEWEFNLDRSVLGQVVRTCEPVLIDDLSDQAGAFHDASVLSSQGFKAALILPLMSRNRAIGALSVVARRAAAFTREHRDAMQPLAEVLAFAYAAEQQRLALAKFRTMETLAEMSVGLSADINSALQAILGQSGVLQRVHPEMSAELDVIVQQAERVSDLLERLRSAADDHLHDTGAGPGIPSSPEAFAQENFN